MELDISTNKSPALAPSDWTYVGEGGANLLLRYVGPTSCQFSGKLLRLRKKGKVSFGRADGEESVEAGIGVEESLYFVRNVALELLGEEFGVGTTVIKLDEGFVDLVTEELEKRNSRPAERVLKDQLDERERLGVLVDDLIGASGLAIEIKPKWGFLPSLPPDLPSKSSSLKSTCCRFCAHRIYKLTPSASLTSEASYRDYEQALEEHLEGYCPLDLYSGNSERMARAVEALWRGWRGTSGCGNNLRMWLDGRRLQGAEEDIEHLHSHLTSLSLISTSIAGGVSTEALKLFTAYLLPLLSSSKILPRLKEMQHSLDSLDIEGLVNLVPPKLNQRIFTQDVQPTSSEWEEWKSERLNRIKGGSERKMEDYRFYTMSYLASASFKDCSIFISRPSKAVPEIANNSIAEQGGGGKAEIKLIDLDLKPIQRLGKWSELDQAIWERFEQVMGVVDHGKGELRKCLL